MENLFEFSIGAMKRPVYECRIGGIKLESFRRDRFPIRHYELRDLNLSDLPKNFNLIVCDSNSLTEKIGINLVIMVKRVKDGIIRLLIEESSKSERWSTPEKMEDYFHYRRRFLSALQREKFKVILMQDHFDFNTMLLQYGTDLPVKNMDEVMALAYNRLINIHANCANFSCAV